MSGFYEVFISDVVLQELSDGSYPRKDKFLFCFKNSVAS